MNLTKYSACLLALLLCAGCNCSGNAPGQSAPAPDTAPAAARADAITAAADAAADTAALDATIDAMFAEDDREMARFNQAEAEAAAALRDSEQ